MSAALPWMRINAPWDAKQNSRNVFRYRKEMEFFVTLPQTHQAPHGRIIRIVASVPGMVREGDYTTDLPLSECFYE